MVVISKSTFTHSYAKIWETLTAAMNRAKDAAKKATMKRGNSRAFRDMDIDPLFTSFKGRYQFQFIHKMHHMHIQQSVYARPCSVIVSYNAIHRIYVEFDTLLPNQPIALSIFLKINE